MESCYMVSKEGLEPSRIAPHAPETCASTISPLRQVLIILIQFAHKKQGFNASDNQVL